jgi:hypothetical protein
MPFEANRDRRHHIPKQRHRVINWAEYDAGLRARGSLAVWFSAEAIEGWRAEAHSGRGGRPKCSDLAIATALTPRAVFRLALRQAEGLIGSILALLRLDLAVPDHSTLSRRAEALVTKLGKVPIGARNSPGFVVNRILLPMLNEAFFVLAEGDANPTDIDDAMRLGCRHPMGPLALADLIGLDVLLSVMQTLHRELGDPKYRPAPLLGELVAAGYLGRKSGRGAYQY